MQYNRSFILIVLYSLFALISFHYLTKNKTIREISNSYSMLKIDKPKRIRIFCMILTLPKNFDTKTRVVNQTWAKECDKYFFITKMDNNLTTSVTYEYNEPYPIIQPGGYDVEIYENLTDKVFKTIKYVSQKYNYFDWYLKADDDSFIFMDNLRDYLETKNSSDPFYYGFVYKGSGGYNHGGGSYVIGKESFLSLGKVLATDYKFCPNSGVEDIDIGQCLDKLGVKAASTLDEKNRERFHVLSAYNCFHGDFPIWLPLSSLNEVKKGVECCSEQTISFHYMFPNEIEKLYRLWIRLKNETQKPYNITPILFRL